MKKVLSIIAICLMLGACSFGVSRTYTVNGQEVSKREYEAHKTQMEIQIEKFKKERK